MCPTDEAFNRIARLDLFDEFAKPEVKNVVFDRLQGLFATFCIPHIPEDLFQALSGSLNLFEGGLAGLMGYFPNLVAWINLVIINLGCDL